MESRTFYFCISCLIIYWIFRDGSQLEICCNRKWKTARRTTWVIDLSAGQREGGNFVAKMQWETKSRQAGETWHDDSLLEAPTTILKFPHLSYHPSYILDDRPARAGALASPVSFSFSVFFSVAHGGLGGAQLRLETYDAVIFIAFRRFYAHLNFNACASRAAPARANFSARRGNASENALPFSLSQAGRMTRQDEK